MELRMYPQIPPNHTIRRLIFPGGFFFLSFIVFFRRKIKNRSDRLEPETEFETVLEKLHRRFVYFC